MQHETNIHPDIIFPVFDRLEELLNDGSQIKKQNSNWWIFDKYGNGLVCGATIRELCLNLVLAGL